MTPISALFPRSPAYAAALLENGLEIGVICSAWKMNPTLGPMRLLTVRV